MELLLGCGASRAKKLYIDNRDQWNTLVTVDFNETHIPDVVWNLEKIPLPFADNSADEIHLYEVLEHTGAQGDFQFFFKQFEDFWRILKPGGFIFATVPRWDSMWALGDPSHKRVISAGSLVFLQQAQYNAQAGKTAISDFRWCYNADFELIHTGNNGESFEFVLRAIK